MKLSIFKFINSYGTKIFTSFNNIKESDVIIKLFTGDMEIEKISTKKDNHLFNINKKGDYYVKLIYNTNDDSSYIITSNVIRISKLSSGIIQDCPVDFKKYKDEKVKGVNKYFLEIKVLRKFSDKIKEKISVNIEYINLDLSGIDDGNPLNNYCYLKFDEITNFEKLCELANEIEKLDYVDYCCVVPDTSNYRPLKLPLNPLSTNVSDYISIDSQHYSSDTITPDFTLLQTYLDEPNGMNIKNAWNKTISGSQSVVRHLDYGIYRNHEDLKGSNITVVNSRPETDGCNHGTASAGCIVATKNDFGVTGIAYDCHFYFYDTGDINLIVNDTQVGDIISLDIQFELAVGLLPATAIRSWWEKIKILVDKGATVILAAGNSRLDLSKPGIMNNFGDNGSMLVGACNHNTGKRTGFSNYNQETSLINSWGDWSVVTTGYGSLQKLPGNDRNYSKDYSGTSSATPLCSGALALIQDYAKKSNIILSAWDMREIIKTSNYTEGVSDGIGYRPNVDYALYQVDKLILSDLANQYPDDFLNGALCIPFEVNIDRGSELEYLFNYDGSPLKNLGFVFVYSEQGDTNLEWYKYGDTLINVPVVDDSHEVVIIKLRANKSNECGNFTINTASACRGSHPNRFTLHLECLQEDNLYAQSGKYKGILPLQIKSWSNNDYCLNVMINIDITI
ncbi:TPA: S8 family serine peptidase [Morganella morganii]|nr:S8 family serine peptidase [Morganella morganii]